MVFVSWQISDDHDSNTTGADEEKSHSSMSQKQNSKKDVRANKKSIAMGSEMKEEMNDVIESRFFKKVQEGRIQDYSSFTYTQLNSLRSTFLDNIKKELKKVPAEGAEEALPELNQLADYGWIKEWKFQYDQLG